MTIDQLAERLALSRSTIYHWVRDLPITGSGAGGGWPEAAQRKGNRAMQANYRALRHAAYIKGFENYDALVAEAPTFRDFVCLYIAEGYKRDRNSVSICNSDPAVMRMCHGWMKRLACNPLDYRVQHHADQRPMDLTRFWAGELGVEAGLIRTHRKSNSSRLATRKWRCPHGVLTIRCGDTLFRAELEAWMERTKQGWG